MPILNKSKMLMFMVNNLFYLFKIGIGPSSSHTVGPMIGAANFVEKIIK